MSSARHFVYRYEEDPDSDEVVFDQHGAIAIPRQGSIVERRTAQWSVTSVKVEVFSAETPIFRVSLRRLPLPRV